MALAFTKEPADVILSGNPVHIKVTDSNALKVAKYEDIIPIKIISGEIIIAAGGEGYSDPAYPEDGDYFWIQFDDALLKFEFGPEKDLPLKQAEQSIYEYRLAIANLFATFPDIISRATVHFQQATEQAAGFDVSYFFLRPKKYNKYYRVITSGLTNAIMWGYDFAPYPPGNTLLRGYMCKIDPNATHAYDQGGSMHGYLDWPEYYTEIYESWKTTKRIYLENNNKLNVKLLSGIPLKTYQQDDVTPLSNSIEMFYDEYDAIQEDQVSRETTPVADTSGRIRFNVANIVKNIINNHFSIDINFLTYHALLETYYILAYPRNIETNTYGKGVVSNITRVLHGNIPDHKFGELAGAGQTPWDWMQQRKFLSLRNNTTITDIYTPERLYIIKTDDAKYVKYKITYTDDTTETFTKTIDADQDNYTAIEIDASWLSIAGLTATWQTKTPAKYEVYIEDESGLTSIVYTFTFDTSYQPYARYFMYKNRLGVYEAIRITGLAAFDADIDKDFYKLNEQIEHDNYKQYQQLQASRETSATLNTGWINIEDRERYLEFLQSDDVYWIKKGKAYPVLVEKSKNTIRQDKVNLVAYDFKIRVTNYDDELFTDFGFGPSLPTGGDFNADFNEDFF